MALKLTHVPTQAWDEFVAQHPDGHLLQSSPWGELKAGFEWVPERTTFTSNGEVVAGAQLLHRRLPARLGHLAYVPKGPLVDWDDREQVSALVKALDRTARMRHAIALTVEPDLPDTPEVRARLRAAGFRPAPHAYQPQRTIIVDLMPDEEAILAAMKQKTRYNIRLAARKGVTVCDATEADLPAFHRLMAITAERNRFAVHTPAYYEAAYHTFVPRGWARLLIAEVEEEPVAALMAFALGKKSWYFYGASSEMHREKMPNHLLQWEAMRWAKALGCTIYDLWGVPDEELETLEASFTERWDGLWGVYRFKRGFGGQLVRYVGAWDRVYAPLRYRLYCHAVRLRREMVM